MPFPTMGLGSVQPTAAQVWASGQNSVPSDPIALLQAILGELQALHARLAPAAIMEEIALNDIAPGEWTNVININNSFNSFLVNIRSGTAIVYLGGSRGTRFMSLPASSNPYLVPFPPQQAGQITICADPAATDPLTGSVFVQAY